MSIDPSLVFTAHCVAFIQSWLDRYGVEPVLPRAVLSDALEAPDRWSSTVAVVPELASSPGPNTLVRWLIRYENVAFYDDAGERYRFSRVGHRWSLLRFPSPRPSFDLDSNADPAAVAA